MNTIQVIMSTYNGEKYLKEQLDSILGQKGVEIRLFVRDDGSTDRTLAILREYAQKYVGLTYVQGENCGAKQSFFEAMKMVQGEVEYYALADQDDVWLPEKMEKAVEQMALLDKEKPILYCTKTILADEKLNELSMQMKEIEKIPSFGNALVENICTGCTAVMNQVLFERIKEHIPSYTVMHDWWLYLTASYFGDVIYDENSYILYRQHGGNVLGSRNTYWKELLNRLKNFKNHRGQVRRQAWAFYESYGRELKENKKAGKLLFLLLKAKKNWKYKWQLIRTPEIYRQRTVDNMIFKLLYMGNHI